MDRSWKSLLGDAGRWVIVMLLWTVTAVVGVPAQAVADEDVVHDHVVVVGVVGLRWDDLGPLTTPTLWNLVGGSAVASMAARTVTTIACPDDAWASMSAGARARSNYDQGDTCPRGSLIGPPIAQPDSKWTLAGKSELTRVNNRNNSYGARLGALADTVGCVSAIGPGAAVAAVHADGSVDRYRDTVPANSDAMEVFTRDCPVTIVDAQTAVYGELGDRGVAAAEADAVVASVVAVSGDAAVMVVGLADDATPANLHPMIIDTGGESGWLTSAATRRTGYTQLVDVAPTVAALVGRDVSRTSMSGQVAHVVAPLDGDIADTVASAVNDNNAGKHVPPLSDGFYTVVTMLGLVAIGAAIVVTRRRDSAARRYFAGWLLPVSLVLAALPAATLLANMVPWWRAGNAGAALWWAIIGFSVAIGMVVYCGPWRRSLLGYAVAVSGITAVVIGVDVVVGTPLQFNSLMGYSAIVGARFTGMGNYPFGVFACAVIIFATLVTRRLSTSSTIGVIGVIGVVAILIDGAPMWGNDVGGVITMTPALVLAGFHAAGRRLSVRKIALSLLVGATVITVFGVIDYVRPERQQTHLGRFVAELLAGDAGGTLARKAFAAMNTITSGPLTLLVVGACVAVPLLWRTPTATALMTREPAVASAAIGVATVCVVGFATNDSGIAVPAFALALVAPLFIAIVAPWVRRTGREVGTG